MRALNRTTEIVFAVVGLVVVGTLIGVVLVSGSSPSAGHGAHQAAASQAMDVHGDGLSDSHDGFRIVPETLPEKRGSKVPVAFRILNESGQPQTDYQEHQTRLLHLLVVRDDLHAFQHVHPELDGDTWRAEIEVPDGGQYRMFAEFVPKRPGKQAHPTLLGVPFVIAGDTKFVPLPEPADEVETGGFVVTRPDGATQPSIGRLVTLRFQVADAKGEPAKLEPYLGSYAHISAFNAMTLAATHLHPLEDAGAADPDGELTVHARFEQRGEHRVFVEFQVGGKVHVAAFTVFAT